MLQVSDSGIAAKNGSSVPIALASVPISAAYPGAMASIRCGINGYHSSAIESMIKAKSQRGDHSSSKALDVWVRWNDGKIPDPFCCVFGPNARNIVLAH
jgi:hypothetical protein